MLVMILFSAAGPLSPAQAQENASISAQLAKMTPEEKVGQLFLVTFNGTNVGPDSQIYDLIVNHHIGGVVLTAANDNFVAAPDTAASAYQMIASLQKADLEPPTLATPAPSSVQLPLFIGISQEGGGSPNDQILSGLTTLPDQMAVGATWNRDLARRLDG